MTDLKCPYCDLKISIHIPDDVSPEELKMIKTCSCGKMMETAEETEKRIRRRKIKKKVFYTLMRRQKKTVAVKREGIEFNKCGVTLYAYQRHKYPMICYVIDPETGRSIATINQPLDVVYRHVSHGMIKEFKSKKDHQNGVYYEKLKEEFNKAEKVDELKENQ